MTALTEAKSLAAKLTKAQRDDLAGGKWYLASCDGCGWYGSSRECGTDLGWDDSDVYCPQCHRSGADIGKFGEEHDAAVRAILLEEGKTV